MKRRRGSSKRNQLITTAVEVFAQHGFHAAGIEIILEQSGVTKGTMYNHFRSKDELIIAALKHHEGVFRNGFMRQVESLAKTPHEQLLAIFDAAEAWFMQNNFYGCLFINATGEYSKADTVIRQVCQEYKQLMREYIRKRCDEVGVANSKKLADELALLLEGAIVTAQVSQKPEAARIAKGAAEVLINQAILR